MNSSLYRRENTVLFICVRSAAQSTAIFTPLCACARKVKLPSYMSCFAVELFAHNSEAFSLVTQNGVTDT